jgi:hypothetical protein
METLSFILGMLTIIGMAAAVLLVVGTVKNYRLTNKVKLLQQIHSDGIDGVYRTMHEMFREVELRHEERFREVTNQIEKMQVDVFDNIHLLEDNVDRQVDRVRSDYQRAIEDVINMVDETERGCKSYTDSRIDKFQSNKEATK